MNLKLLEILIKNPSSISENEQRVQKFKNNKFRYFQSDVREIIKWSNVLFCLQRGNTKRITRGVVSWKTYNNYRCYCCREVIKIKKWV